MIPVDPPNGPPGWRDLVGAIDGLRSEMRAGFGNVEARLRQVEIQQAAQSEIRSSSRWLFGFLISVASIGIAIVALIRT